MSRAGPNLLVWDGACGLCAASVKWVLRRDRRGLFLPVPYQNLPPEAQKQISVQALDRAIHVVTPEGQVLRGGKAVLFIGEKLGYYPALLRWWRRSPLVWAAELAYWIVARLRRPFSQVCGLKPPPLPPTPLPEAGPPANEAPPAPETSAWCGTSAACQEGPPDRPAQ